MWHPLEEAQDVDNKIKVNVSLSFGGKAICLSSSLCLCIAVGQVRGRCKRELGIQDMFIISQNHLINIYLCKRDRLPTKQKLSKKIIDNVLCNKSYTLPCCHKWLAVSHILQKGMMRNTRLADAMQVWSCHKSSPVRSIRIQEVFNSANFI